MYGWLNWTTAILILSYFVLILIFIALALWLNARGDGTGAMAAMYVPPAIAIGIPAAVIILDIAAGS